MVSLFRQQGKNNNNPCNGQPISPTPQTSNFCNNNNNNNNKGQSVVVSPTSVVRMGNEKEKTKIPSNNDKKSDDRTPPRQRRRSQSPSWRKSPSFLKRSPFRRKKSAKDTEPDPSSKSSSPKPPLPPPPPCYNEKLENSAATMDTYATSPPSHNGNDNSNSNLCVSVEADADIDVTGNGNKDDNDTTTNNNDTASAGDDAGVYVSLDYHDVIQNHEWDKLEEMLKKYDFKKYKPKVTDSPKPKRKLRVLRYIPEFVQKAGATAPPPMSPLLYVDEFGRTPLHLACLEIAPDKLLLKLLMCERNAASVADKQDGQLPLHLAAMAGRYNHVLDKFIRAFPAALKTKNYKGQTPIALLVHNTKEEFKQDNDPEYICHWGFPKTKQEADWQAKQIKRWNKVEFLVECMVVRKKSLIPSEHQLVVQVMEAGAPEFVVDKLIQTTQKYIEIDDVLAADCITICLKRRYPIKLLKKLLSHCARLSPMIQDATHKGMLRHYKEGCVTKNKKSAATSTSTSTTSNTEKSFGKELVTWATAKRKNSPKMDNQELSPACNDWWERLQYLIAHCGYGADFHRNEAVKEDHFLHAALCIPETPPSLLQLLMIVYRGSLKKKCPIWGAVPLHLACTKWKFDILKKDNEFPLERMMKQMLNGDTNQVWDRHKKRLPLHLALAAGQSWTFVKALVDLDKRTLGVRDPQTKLFPFQLAAQAVTSKHHSMMLRSHYTPAEWRDMSDARKRTEMSKAKKFHEVRQVTTIFELLRRYPDAIGSKVARRRVPTTKTSKISGAGMVATHYLGWCYKLGGSGGAIGWEVRVAQRKLLRDAIAEGTVPKGLSQWFNKLKYWIWESLQSETKNTIPKRDEFLLHAALYNSDTPPLVIELLLELYPTSAQTALPDSETYPLHIAANTVSYMPQQFEIPATMGTLELTLQAYPEATRIPSLNDGRIPLHIAIEAGKGFKEIKPLIKEDPDCLNILDPQTGLFPFQLMACRRAPNREQRLWFVKMAQNRTRNLNWESLSPEERGIVLRRIKKDYDLNNLTAVYDMLRRRPYLVSTPLDNAKQNVNYYPELSKFNESDEEFFLDLITTANNSKSMGTNDGYDNNDNDDDNKLDDNPDALEEPLETLVSPRRSERPSLLLSSSGYLRQSSRRSMFNREMSMASISEHKVTITNNSNNSADNSPNGSPGPHSRSPLLRRSTHRPRYDREMSMSSFYAALESPRTSFNASNHGGDDLSGFSAHSNSASGPSLGAFFDMQRQQSFTRTPQTQRQSIQSLWEVNSRGSVVYDDYNRPIYDDDCMSAMGSVRSSANLGSSWLTPNANSASPPRSGNSGIGGQKRINKPLHIKLPDLGIDDDNE